MKSAMRWLEILLGITFVVAAALKALDMTAFAVQVSYYGVLRDPGWVKFAAYASVIVETLLGAAMVAGIRLRGLVYLATGAMLLGFTALIAYAWRYHGLADCGCFGKYVQMSPLASIVKNIAMLGVTAALGWGLATGRLREAVTAHARWIRAIASAVCIVTVLAISIYAQVTASPVSAQPIVAKEQLPAGANAPFAQFTFAGPQGTVDLGKGIHLVAMLSATCEHCMASVAGLNALTKAPDMPPLTGLILGSPDEIESFRLQTAPDFPLFSVEALTFMSFIGSAPPRFILERDGKQLQFWDMDAPSVEIVSQALAALR